MDILSLLKEGSFVKHLSNPILTPTCNGWDKYFVRDPFIIEYSKTYFMYYMGAGQYHSIGLATSKDGISFTKLHKPILCHKDLPFKSNFVEFGSIIPLKSGFLMYFTYGIFKKNQGIGVAESGDLIHWKVYKNPVWMTCEDLHTASELIPFVFNSSDLYYMYTENPYNGWKVDLSISNNPFIFDTFKTVWRGASNLKLDTCGVANPKIFSADSKFYMGYNGFDIGNPGNLRLAVSDDLIKWESFNAGKPLLEKIRGTWDCYRMENTFLLFDDFEIKLYYFAEHYESNSHNWSIGLATLRY